jgi:prevent-host-death family protein
MKNRSGKFQVRGEAMEHALGVTEARKRLSEVVDQVRYRGDTVTLLKNGKPAAVLVPIEVYERWKTRRRDAVAAIKRIQASVTPGLSDEEAMKIALEAQEAVRKSSTSG